MAIEFHPEARRDFDEGFAWYAERSEEAAYAFLAAVNDSLAHITETPDRFEPIDELHRRCLTRRFPYSVVYRMRNEAVVIVAIAHAAREPDYWTNR